MQAYLQLVRKYELGPFQFVFWGGGTEKALRTRRNLSHQFTIFPVNGRRAGETPNECFEHGGGVQINEGEAADVDEGD